MYRTAQQRQWDNQNILDYAKKEGLEKGLEAGALAREREIVKNLKTNGIDLKTIAEATGLSIEEIVSL